MSTAISTPEKRAGVESRAASDPGFAAALAEQRQGRDAIATAAESTGAPLALRTRVEELAAPKGRRHGDRRPSARTRLGGLRWPGAGLVAGAVAVVLAVIVLSGGGPGDRRRGRRRRPRADRQVASVPPDSKLLQENVGDVAFPNYAAKFGWKPVGTRTDEIGGRKTRTVFYEKDGKRIAYTIVDGDPLSTPGDAATATREGTDLQWIETQGRTVVTWERGGRTCVLSASSPTSRRNDLLELAGWKGKGGVAF